MKRFLGIIFTLMLVFSLAMLGLPSSVRAASFTVNSAIITTSVADSDMTGTGKVAATTFLELKISIHAYIDGRSQLIVKANTVQWHHLDYAAPGRHGFVDLPTVINGFDWYPLWPDIPDAENRQECFSSIYTNLSPPLLDSDMQVQLSVIQARYSLTVVQYPTAGNNYTLILEFNDNPLGGPDWYECELIITPAEPPPPPTTCTFVNNGFETGDFAGWTTVNGTGSELTPWNVSTGGTGWFGNGFPAEGTFFAQNGFDGDAGLFYDIYQEVTIPADATSAQLSWKERIQWDLLSFGPATLPRLYEVTIQPTGGGVPIATLFTMTLDPGTVGDTGYVAHSVDLLVAAPGINGSTVRINWHEEIPETYTGPAQFDLDDICLTFTVSPPPQPPAVPSISLWGGIVAVTILSLFMVYMARKGQAVSRRVR